VLQWLFEEASFGWIEAAPAALFLSDLSMRGYFVQIRRRFASSAFLIAPES